MSTLSGKTALITGSVQGIGLAVAEVLAGAGARIAVHGLADAQQAEAAVSAVRPMRGSSMQMCATLQKSRP
ncbi:SDR family NAD(P)-dependent oxidoreductase [Roseibium sp.]|uniref:SDR family NAD(P)-dependent oxidoreductase n=1 Tax=Roseibium sp. TaxID=1936156 RepID=UPI0025F80601|nr:SDR family NAD(P)-dependent oxidoreductase [Roseibium sp.]